jgi:hypothetical protein
VDKSGVWPFRYCSTMALHTHILQLTIGPLVAAVQRLF